METLISILDFAMGSAMSIPKNKFLELSLTFGGTEYIQSLLQYALHKNCAKEFRKMSARLVLGLVYGNEMKQTYLYGFFQNELNDFHEYDTSITSSREVKLDLFSEITAAVQNNELGNLLKDYFLELGLVEIAVNYLVLHAPSDYLHTSMAKIDLEQLNLFISKPIVKYILRILSGLAKQHQPTQTQVAKTIIPILHMLEQISSDAENLMEILKEDVASATKVEEVRTLTKIEKKKLAMATRQKQLSLMGMKTNEKGQVTATVSLINEIEILKEETGLVCFICREGYTCQPAKVMGIYTFSKKCALSEFTEHKMYSHSTVTHFNIVHLECHISAIRQARGRDEWESASLQNTNTKCNGILPLW